MAILGVRKFIKSKVKGALGIDSQDTSSFTESSVRITEQAAHLSEAPDIPSQPVEEAEESDVSVQQTATEKVADEPVEEKGLEERETSPEKKENVSVSLQNDDVVGEPLTMESVQEVLDDMVRPALQGDGGDISLVKIEDSNIFVQLVGACSTCPSSVMTMKMGVEALLKEEFPSMNELIEINAMENGA